MAWLLRMRITRFCLLDKLIRLSFFWFGSERERERISHGKLSAYSSIRDLGGGFIRTRSISDAEKKVGRTSKGRACAMWGHRGARYFVLVVLRTSQTQKSREEQLTITGRSNWLQSPCWPHASSEMPLGARMTLAGSGNRDDRTVLLTHHLLSTKCAAALSPFLFHVGDWMQGHFARLMYSHSLPFFESETHRLTYPRWP